MILIKLLNICKEYKEGSAVNRVLNNISFDFLAAEIVIMYGRSGSGKSTLLNLISGIDKPDSGSIFIDDIDITKLNEHQRTLIRRRKIGFVFQFFNLIPTLTVLENILLPLELNKLSGKNERNKALHLLEQVGLKARQDSFPDRLSGGEQQRVAIARALIHEPAIILADEPTGNLDFETGKQIIELLDKLVKNEGKQMLMATHSKEVIGLADRILSIKDGQINILKSESEI